MKIRCAYGILFLIILCCQQAIGQTAPITIEGTITNTANRPLPWASIKIKGVKQGATADSNGHFLIIVNHSLPLTLTISNIGFSEQKIRVENVNETINIVLISAALETEDVFVYGSSRFRERYLASPISIAVINTAAIRNAAAPDFYTGIGNITGVDITPSSIGFQTISTRGFNASGNQRFNQFTDGMTNEPPGLSFSVGSMIGLTELDVDNMELLPGASSALYGSGGTNGTLLLTSKDPFKHQGLSFQYKQGVNHLSDPRHGAAPVFDGEFRFAKAFQNKAKQDKFAIKIAAKYFNAEDWHANDSTNLLRSSVLYSSTKPGNRRTDPNYDGVNVFGDEASTNMQAIALGVRAQYSAVANMADSYLSQGYSPQQIAEQFSRNSNLKPLIPAIPFFISTSTVKNPYSGIYNNQLVSRQGYNEKNLVDYNAYNFKVNGGLYYKITKDIEASVQAYFGRGSTVYTGSDRYVLKNLQVGQYKFEVKSNNWFLRAYTTQENSGDSYTATTAAVAINRAWKSDANWFQQYAATYGAARMGMLPNMPPLTEAQAEQAARTIAETGRFLPGSQQYQDTFNKAVNTPISQGGAKFTDKSNLYHSEAQYHFANLKKFADVLAGASYRVYHLNSGGTIFADTTGPINIYEYGAYVQLQKMMMDSVVKLTASGRYDKNENFKGRFTPRFSALVRVAKDNYVRLSYQTGYRFPSTQDQYLNLLTPKARLIGGLPQFNTFYHFDKDTVYTAESIDKYRVSNSPLQTAVFAPVKPETVHSYEIGYRGRITKQLLVDAYAYMSHYKNFIGRISVGRGKAEIDSNRLKALRSPATTSYYTFAVNSAETIKAHGWGIGLEYQLPKNTTATFNISGDRLQQVPDGFITFFNSPKIRYNIGLSKPAEAKSFGFSVVYRWQGKINWESTFGSGPVPSYGSMDAQISYVMPKVNTLIKLGGSNIFNNYYRSAFGNPYVGALYYISFGYNVF